MRVVIIEDEVNLSNYLKETIQSVRSDAEVVAQIRSVKEANEYFKENESPDIIFSDIRLLDGISFSIFEDNDIKSSIVFTTAYDEYVMKSFDYNNIYYILKPVKKADIESAFAKYDRQSITSEKALYTPKAGKKLTRLLIEKSDALIPVNISDIVFIESDFKASRIYTADGQKYPCSMNLKKLEEILDPEMFVRVSRQWILKVDLISQIQKNHFGKYKLTIKPGYELSEVEVSKDRIDKIVSSF